MSNKIENFIENYNPTKRATTRNRPEGLHLLATIDGPYQRVWFYSERGKAMIALGCRRYTLKEASLHWDEAKRVYNAWRNTTVDGRIPAKYKDRSDRARDMSDTVLPFAYRRARRLGLKYDN